MQLLYAIDINTMYETLYDFFKAAEAIEKIHLLHPQKWQSLNNNREESKNYRVFRRRQFHWLQGVDQCNKWTQTCANVVVEINREECWVYGTFSHSLLKVRGFFYILVDGTTVSSSGGYDNFKNSFFNSKHYLKTKMYSNALLGSYQLSGKNTPYFCWRLLGY